MPGDTSLGGGRRDFPATTVGLLSRLSGSSTFDPRSALELLASRYWKPAYLFLRSAKAKSNEDAKDLAQDFFVWMMKTDFLSHADPARGRFRSFVKVSLKHYLTSEDRKTRRLKRGGDKAIVGLEGAMENVAGVGIPDPKAADPEQSFDQAWRAGLLTRAIERTRKRFAEEGRSRAFRIYESYEFVAREVRPTYQDLARTHGLTANQIESSLESVREAIGGAVRAELAETTADDRELREEWNALFGS